MTTKIKPPIKTCGGKYILSSWIIEQFPENYESYTYCEPFCSGASVFLNKLPSHEELISDIDRGVVCIFKALRDEPEEFIRRIKKINYTENTFKRALNKSKNDIDDYIDKAINEYVLRRMSNNSGKTRFAWKDRCKNKSESNTWESMYKQLPLIAKRVKDVDILNVCFKEVVKVWDNDNTLTFLDPPAMPLDMSKKTIDPECEMSVDDHVAMLDFANGARGKVIISGHASPLYKRHLAEWNIVKRDAKNTKKERIELLWMNY